MHNDIRKILRMERKVTRKKRLSVEAAALIVATEAFYRALEKEAGVDRAEAREIWTDFSRDMTIGERGQIIMEGELGGDMVGVWARTHRISPRGAADQPSTQS